jgi:hypothetical protein
MSRSGTRAKRRENLWRKDPHCIYCRKITVLISQNGGCLPDNAATLEHLFNRLNPARKNPKNGETRTALACSKCNWEMGQMDQIKFQTIHRLRSKIRNTKYFLEDTLKDFTINFEL